MTGQKRKNSLIHSDTISPPGSRKNSLMDHMISVDYSVHSAINETDFTEDLLQYSARKFSIFVPFKPKKYEQTILDDAEFYMKKKECDYGMCQCCHVEKKILTNWESIEEIIENDPEIIFDSEDNPIMVENHPEMAQNDAMVENAGVVNDREGSADSNSTVSTGLNLTKRINLNKIPDLFRTIINKFSHSSDT